MQTEPFTVWPNCENFIFHENKLLRMASFEKFLRNELSREVNFEKFRKYRFRSWPVFKVLKLKRRK